MIFDMYSALRRRRLQDNRHENRLGCQVTRDVSAVDQSQALDGAGGVPVEALGQVGAGTYTCICSTLDAYEIRLLSPPPARFIFSRLAAPLHPLLRQLHSVCTVVDLAPRQQSCRHPISRLMIPSERPPSTSPRKSQKTTIWMGSTTRPSTTAIMASSRATISEIWGEWVKCKSSG